MLSVQHSAQGGAGSKSDACAAPLKRATESDCEVVCQNKRFRSLEASPASLHMPAMFPGITPGITPWGPFQMPQMSGMGVGAGGMMSFCMPPPFIPPFMMPAAMAMWQQAVQRATSYPHMGMAACCPSAAPAPAACKSVRAPAPASSICKTGVVGTASVEKPERLEKESSQGSMMSERLPFFESDDSDKEDAEAFHAMLDNFLGNSGSTAAHPLKESERIMSVGSGLNLLNGSMSDLTDFCSPLDLKWSNNDSQLDLLGLDLDLGELTPVDLGFSTSRAEPIVFTGNDQARKYLTNLLPLRA